MEPNGFEESRLKAISLDHLGGEVHALEHRRNYETLKAAFEQLKHDYIRSEESWKLKSRQMHMKERKALTRLEEANSQIHALLTELNSRTQLENDPQWVESVRLEIHQKYEDEIDRAHSCILAARDENKKLNRKIATLQSQLEFAKTETQGDWQQQQILYEAEIANLRHIKEDLLSRNQCLSSNELDRSKDECKQNAQLQTKCQLLTDEVESLKKQLDSQKAIFLGGNENLLKNMTNLKIKNCELEAERENLNKQLCVMRREVEQLRSELHMEKQRVSDATHASTEAEFKLSQLTQRTRGELANLRLEAQEQRTAIEKQRDQFASKAQELEHKLELVSARCQQVESDAAAHALASTEKEVIARDQWIREKTILEARCAELSNRLKATQITSSTDNVKNQFDHIGSSRTTANCKCKQTLDDQKEEIARLNEKLNHAELLNSQLNELLRQKTSEETRGEQSNEVGQLQLTLFEKLKERDELKSQLHTVRANLKRYMEDASKKKQRLSRHIRRLKELNQLEKLETEKLKTENEILRQNVPQEEYNRIRLLLNDLKRRHEEYQSIILGPAHPFLPQLCASRANLEYSAEWAKEKVVQDMELSSPSKSTAYNESTTQTSENDRGVLDHLHSP